MKITPTTVLTLALCGLAANGHSIGWEYTYQSPAGTVVVRESPMHLVHLPRVGWRSAPRTVVSNNVYLVQGYQPPRPKPQATVVPPLTSAYSVELRDPYNKGPRVPLYGPGEGRIEKGPVDAE